MFNNSLSLKFVLNKESELRFEVGDRGRKLSLKLRSGFAEVFGAELTKGKAYEFGYGSKTAVFTWQGCVLELSYKPTICYVANETPMPIYLNCHTALENMRQAAEAQGKMGPVVLVVGPPDVGKSSLCQLLLNYAAKLNRRPLYVDLDPELGHVSIPGTVCALPIDRQASVPEGFHRQLPLVLHYGYYSPEANIDHFNTLISTLAEHCTGRIKRQKQNKSAGIVIDTCGACKDVAYITLLHTAHAFEVDVVLVIDNEKLQHQLTTDLPDFVKVIGIPKNGGAVGRSVVQRSEAREQSINEYFYGRRVRLSSFIHKIKFDELKLYTTLPSLPSSCMPLNMLIKPAVRISQVKLTPMLLRHLLVLTYAKVADHKAPLANVMGFLCVTDVDFKRRTITVISPQLKPLPKNHVLFISEVQFFD